MAMNNDKKIPHSGKIRSMAKMSNAKKKIARAHGQGTSPVLKPVPPLQAAKRLAELQKSLAIVGQHHVEWKSLWKEALSHFQVTSLPPAFDATALDAISQAYQSAIKAQEAVIKLTLRSEKRLRKHRPHGQSKVAEGTARFGKQSFDQALQLQKKIWQLSAKRHKTLLPGPHKRKLRMN